MIATPRPRYPTLTRLRKHKKSKRKKEYAHMAIRQANEELEMMDVTMQQCGQQARSCIWSGPRSTGLMIHGASVASWPTRWLDPPSVKRRSIRRPNRVGVPDAPIAGYQRQGVIVGADHYRRTSGTSTMTVHSGLMGWRTFTTGWLAPGPKSWISFSSSPPFPSSG